MVENEGEQMIPNHVSGTLSKLDMEMAKHIPPGGNWKDIPTSVPSKRLENIRKSFAEGKGSRSTYYGRLLPNKPSYTINTYFSRLGNGCHLHYDPKQIRVLSQREAARLQSFPDDFIFVGSKTSINKQIGNAVPPILAYQLAKQFGEPGIFVDLFAGAGGLSLGFTWAGWKSVLANDIDKTFLETYSKNIDPTIIVGDIQDNNVTKSIIRITQEMKIKYPNLPFIIIGGPPCQGFSTAGNKRSMKDSRNHLYLNYRKIVELTKPDDFLFENVTGLVNMEGGKVLKSIIESLESVTGKLTFFKLKAENFAVPQRRTRVFIVGKKDGSDFIPPNQITQVVPISVKDAISDLPALNAGEDGSNKEYISEAITDYQKFMRQEIPISDFLNIITNRHA